MRKLQQSEVIVVRALTDSDLGLFAAHRPSISSKQRAMNINSSIAQQILSPEIIRTGKAYIKCKIIFGDIVLYSKRHFGKVGKNWRLGGEKIDGEDFYTIDSRDFALIRSIEKNDGSQQISILFVSRRKQQFQHARISRLVEPTLKDSMEIYHENSGGFQQLSMLFKTDDIEDFNKKSDVIEQTRKNRPSIPPIPRISSLQKRNRSIEEKVHSPHIIEQMLKASSDLSAPAQTSFIETITLLASQLRTVLLASKRIINIKVDHKGVWQAVKGQRIGFVDGGLANLSVLGSVPIAARVGGYVVKPGDKSKDREEFIELKKLINELYTSDGGGVYNGEFPDISALRDAARISIEAAGAVQLAQDKSIKFLFLHGALVNPVSRYTDIMRDGVPRFHFPNFSAEAIKELLPNVSPVPSGKDTNFINIYLKQLQALKKANASVCGVIEREATTSSVIRAILNNLDDHIIAPLLPMPPSEWKHWFKRIVDPADDDEIIGQRITDSLLFRCVLEPGEALIPVEIDRNEPRRAPQSWKEIITMYPKPLVSYLQPSEWSAPIRLEIFDKDFDRFQTIAELIMHCSLLLPQYAFPAGLDIVDKFAKIPNWMSKPINTNTAVQALKIALYKGDEKMFDSLRRMLCGSNREWLLRPGILK